MEITPPILTEAYSRALAGRRPAKNAETFDALDADSVIVAEIIDHFERRRREAPVDKDELVICTDNVDDVGTFEEAAGGPVLHEDIRRDLEVSVSGLRHYRNFPRALAKEFVLDPIGVNPAANDPEDLAAMVRLAARVRADGVAVLRDAGRGAYVRYLSRALSDSYQLVSGAFLRDVRAVSL